MEGLQILAADTEAGAKVLLNAGRPLYVNDRTGVVVLRNARGLQVNSLLLEKEWVELDNVIMTAARYPLRAVNDLKSRGLTHPLGGLETLVSQYTKSGEVTGAAVSMSGQGGSQRDLPENIPVGVPIPIIFKEFSIDTRTLLASRRMGDGIDVTAAMEGSRVVAEGAENLLINGWSGRLNGALLYGYRNHPDRNTDTAANYGGGAWSTITNIVPTVAGMVTAANADNHYGPFVLYASQASYNLAALQYYADASGDTPLVRIRKMPMIADVLPLPVNSLPAGELLLVEMAMTTVDWAEAQDIQMVEWTSGDGMQSNFKLMMAAAPRVKSRFDGKSGIIHATSA